jgi:hypothetical protein
VEGGGRWGDELAWAVGDGDHGKARGGKYEGERPWRVRRAVLGPLRRAKRRQSREKVESFRPAAIDHEPQVEAWGREAR